MSEFESTLPENISESAIAAGIPINYLWGIKSPGEYSHSRSKRIAKGLNEDGIDFLTDRPILTALVPINSGSMLVIINGHHRTREAPNHHIYHIPTRILSIALLADYVEIPETVLLPKIRDWTSRTIYDFDRKMNISRKNYQTPKALDGIYSVNDIETIIGEDNHFGIIAIAQLHLLTK